MSPRQRLTAALLVSLLLVAHAASASTPDGGTLDALGSDESKTVSAAGSHEAEGGTINNLNLSTNTQTSHWQGYYGSVSGQISLASGSSTFYSWSLDSVRGELYATSNSGTPDWADVSCASPAQASSADSNVFGTTPSSDSIADTYVGGTHSAFDVGVSAFSSDSCLTLDTGGSFENVLLNDGSAGAASSMLYVSLLEEDQQLFNGETGDYELLVPEDQSGNSDSTAYYFWVELN